MLMCVVQHQRGTLVPVHGMMYKVLQSTDVLKCAPLPGAVCCCAADPTPAEIIAGVNLADVHKCNCTSRFCAAAAAGVLPFSGDAASDKVSLAGTDPAFVFDDLPADAFCTTCESCTM
jgi:hypothetical protein